MSAINPRYLKAVGLTAAQIAAIIAQNNKEAITDMSGVNLTTASGDILYKNS